MYQESAGDGFSQTHVPNCDNNQSFSMDEQSSYTQIPISQQEVAVAVAAASALEMELQHHLEIEQCYGNKNGGEIPDEIVHGPNWQDMSSFNGEHQYQNGHHHQIYTTGSFPADSQYPTFLASLGLLGDINLPLNLPPQPPPQPPLLRELFHSLPHGGYTVGGSRNGSLFNVVDERENGGLYQNGDGRSCENGVFEFNAAEMDCIGKNRDGKEVKHFATERHRRVLLNDKYQALRRLVPTPSKNDRASIVGDAINYINELKRTVSELKVLVEKKRCAQERLKRPKTEDAMEGNESKPPDDLDHPHNGSALRSSWLQRKSKNTEVDVRIIDDEVTVKLVQQKRVNCLLFVSKVLDELHLDLHHVAGGVIGDYYSYLFNSKICEGSIVYASALANKLIEVVDKQYAAIASTSS